MRNSQRKFISHLHTEPLSLSKTSSIHINQKMQQNAKHPRDRWNQNNQTNLPHNCALGNCFYLTSHIPHHV